KRDLRESHGEHRQRRRRFLFCSPNERSLRAPNAECRATRGTPVELQCHRGVLPAAIDAESTTANEEPIQIEEISALLSLIVGKITLLVLRLHIAGEHEAQRIGESEQLGSRRPLLHRLCFWR